MMFIKPPKDGPKVLVLDIETLPIKASVWNIRNQYIAINQIEEDWCIAAWAAKWVGDPPSKMMYMDQRRAKDVRDDSRLLPDLWKLLDECDFLVSKNGKRFDVKKIKTRLLIAGFKPVSGFTHIDTETILRREFGFTSNKLEFVTEKVCKKYKKQKHKKYPGQALWRECEARNQDAWREMEKYNKYDVLSTEELYQIIIAWDGIRTFNPSLFEEEGLVCSCGSKRFQRNGFRFKRNGRYQKFYCVGCGSTVLGKTNYLSAERKKSLFKPDN